MALSLSPRVSRSTDTSSHFCGPDSKPRVTSRFRLAPRDNPRSFLTMPRAKVSCHLLTTTIECSRRQIYRFHPPAPLVLQIPLATYPVSSLLLACRAILLLPCCTARESERVSLFHLAFYSGHEMKAEFRAFELIGGLVGLMKAFLSLALIS